MSSYDAIGHQWMQKEEQDFVKEASIHVAEASVKHATVTNGFMLQTIKVATKCRYFEDKYIDHYLLIFVIYFKKSLIKFD